MASGKTKYQLTPKAEKMAEQRGYSTQPQQKLPKELFDVLMKQGDIATLLSEGGVDLTRQQLAEVRKLAGQQSPEKLQEMAESLEGSTGYKNFMGMPIISKILSKNKKTTAPKTDKKSKAQSQSKKRKDPEISTVPPNTIQQLRVGDSEADILAKMLNLQKADHDKSLKRYRDYESKKKELDSERDREFKELMEAFGDKRGAAKKLDEHKQFERNRRNTSKFWLLGGAALAGMTISQRAFAKDVKSTSKDFSTVMKELMDSIGKSLDMESPIKHAEIPKDVKQDKEFLDQVRQFAKSMNIDPADLMAVMAVETGGTFSPSIKNPKSSATGLIQFTEATAKGLGTSTKELAGMSRVEQFQYVKKYLEKNKLKQGATSGEIYAKVFLPARSESEVLTRKGENFYRNNEGLDVGNKEFITREDLSKVAERQKKTYDLPKLFQPEPSVATTEKPQVPVADRSPRRKTQSVVVVQNNSTNVVQGDVNVMVNKVIDSDKPALLARQYYRKE